MSTRRGRPPSLSREAILQCALEQLEQGEVLTMTGVARAMGVAPMTLYTHVRNREDLVERLSALVLERLTLDIDPEADWHRQARQWMQQLHDHLLDYPQIVHLVGQGGRASLPQAWLPVHAVLIRCLQAGGLEGVLLARASRWLAQAVTADVMLEHERQQANPALREASALERILPTLEPADQATFRTILPHLEETPDRIWRFQLDCIEESLKTLGKPGPA